jgi:hypothetical protein
MFSTPNTMLNFVRFAFLLEFSLVMWDMWSDLKGPCEFVIGLLMAVLLCSLTVGIFSNVLLIVCSPLIILWRLLTDIRSSARQSKTSPSV